MWSCELDARESENSHIILLMKNRIQLIADRVRGTLILAALVTASLQFGWRNTQAKDNQKPAAVKFQIDEAAVSRDGKLSISLAPVVKKVAPSVVKVFTTAELNGDGGRFFNPFGPERSKMPRRKMKQHGLGSGVIVSKDGYILTNNHVVEHADEVKVALSEGGEEYTAKVIGTDAKTDIAVLKIEANDLPFVTITDSDKIEVGDVVLALGNPFGLGQTVTTGIVSATGRATLGMEYEDFIQTDAAINPGNSGGALVDAEGRLIGINTAILSQTGGNQGIGFAVPVNLARHVMESFVTHGRMVRGFLGVHIQDVTPALAREFGLKGQGGALVAEISPKSPAEESGLRPGDVVLGFDGKRVKESRLLKLQVSQTAPDQPVNLEIMRDGKRKNIQVTLREMPRNELAARGSEDSNGHRMDPLDGVTVGDVDRDIRQELRLPKEVSGALVTRVKEDSVPFDVGLREGDVILEINRTMVRTANEAVAVSEKSKEKSTLLRIWSRGSTRYLVIDAPHAG